MRQVVVRFSAMLSLMAGLVLPGCVAATKYSQLEEQLARANEDLSYTQQQLADAEALLQESTVDGQALTAATERAEAAERERLRLEQILSEVEGKSSLLGSRGIEVIYDEESGMAGFRGGNDVFFVSGSDALSKDGKATLDMIVEELNRLEGPIRVDGHTDSDPVVKTKDKYPFGNIQLGASRAISVRSYLVERGIPEERIWIASHGPYKPVVKGDTADAKSRNRRVEILVPVGRRPAGTP